MTVRASETRLYLVLLAALLALLALAWWTTLPRAWLGLLLLLLAIAVGTLLRHSAQRHRTERGLRLAAERDSRRFFELSEAMLAIATPDGWFTRLNPAWQRVLGWTEAELRARPYIDFVHPADREATLAEAGKLAAGTTTVSFENRYRCKDGAYRWLLWTTAPYLDEGLLYATATDITARKAREAEMLALTEELARSNQELSAFTSVASHDLREPLWKIQTFGERLAAQAGAALDEECRGYVQRMVGAALRMQEMIDDLLAFSQVHKEGTDLRPVDLGKIAAEVAEDLEALLERQQAQLQIGPLPVLEADAAQLRRLLQNLLGNALKFARPGVPPQVALTAEPAELEALDGIGPARPGWRLRVADNGIGFEPKDAERIFGLFQRLHGRTRYPGAGIGLAICQRIAERHGGSISAEGRPGVGATFVVELPSVQPRPGSDGERRAAAADRTAA